MNDIAITDHYNQRIAKLEAELKQLRDAIPEIVEKAIIVEQAAQAVVDGLFLAVKSDYHYSQKDTDLMDALKAALDNE
jgi:hypothetical protein